VPRRLREDEVEACELERTIEIPDPFLIPDYPNAPGKPRNEAPPKQPAEAFA
jgi:hypothetical protein